MSRYGYALSGLLLGLAGLATQRASAFDGDTLLYFNGTDLEGFAYSVLDPSDEPYGGCGDPVTYDEGAPFWVQSCWYRAPSGAWVDTFLYTPESVLDYYDWGTGLWLAEVDYIIQPSHNGTWTAVSNHFMEMAYFEYDCHWDGDFVFLGCDELTFGYTDYEYVGSSSASVDTEPPPQFPCDASGVTNLVISTMQNWPALAYERGGTVVCQDNSAVATAFRDSFNTVFPGAYTPTNDPCRLVLSTAGAIGGFHSHPRFTNVNQMNRENGCHNRTNYIEEEIGQVNQENYSFSDGDELWPKPQAEGGTGTPFYLLVPNGSQIKMLSPPGNGLPTTVWQE